MTSQNRARERGKWQNQIWNGKFAPKLKLLLWKVLQDALPVGENFMKRGMGINSSCIHCGELEFTFHLLFHCDYAASVWALAPLKRALDVSQVTEQGFELQVLENLICLPPTGVGEGPVYPWILWSIWTARNNRLFENKTFTAEETIIKAIASAREWQQAHHGIYTQLNLKQQIPLGGKTGKLQGWVGSSLTTITTRLVTVVFLKTSTLLL